jgi:hypothetical protein
MNKLIINNLNWLVPTAVTITGIYLKYKHNKEQIEIQNNLAYYPERLKIYHSIQEILCKLISSPNNAETLWQTFRQKTRDVPILFGKDIQDKCTEIYRSIVRLNTIKQKLKRSHRISDDELHRICDNEARLLIKITDSSRDLPKIFQPYIGTVKDQTTPKISYRPYPPVLSIPPAP